MPIVCAGPRYGVSPASRGNFIKQCMLVTTSFSVLVRCLSLRAASSWVCASISCDLVRAVGPSNWERLGTSGFKRASGGGPTDDLQSGGRAILPFTHTERTDHKTWFLKMRPLHSDFEAFCFWCFWLAQAVWISHHFVRRPPMGPASGKSNCFVPLCASMLQTISNVAELLGKQQLCYGCSVRRCHQPALQ